MSNPLTNMESFKYKRSIFSLLCQLTIVFIVVQIVFSCINNLSFLQTWRVVNEQVSFPPIILPGLFQWLLAEFLLHAIFLILLWLSILLVANIFQLSEKKITDLSVTLWVVAVIFIIMTNQYYFPVSQFASLTNQIIPQKLAKIFMILTGGILLIAMSLACAQILIFVFNNYKRNLIITILIIVAIAIARLSTYHLGSTTEVTTTKPNVILIGIDSLRPNYIGYYGNSAHLTPHVDSFLHNATRFTNAISPLARTFSAWVSILTGNDPLTTNARNDLMPRDLVKADDNLAFLFKQQGYTTVYAIDDNRFSHIDESYGFDYVIQPGINFNNILLGNLNDFPLSNLFINTQIGKWLFPYNFINRQSLPTYQPITFDRLVEHFLRNTKQPLFLCVHFCLPHAPYSWSEKPPVPSPPQNSIDARILYANAVQAVDIQFGNLLSHLQQYYWLDNAIVIVLSDHGEALGPHERLTTEKKYIPDPKNSSTPFKDLLLNRRNPQKLDFSVGHGTDILSLNQNKVLLGVQLFGLESNNSLNVTIPTNLDDIKPTLLDLLHWPTEKTDGMSLAPYIVGHKTIEAVNRSFYLENGFTPEALENPQLKYAEIIEESAKFFIIDPKNGRLTLNTSPTVYPLILNNKQYALIHYPWMLAIYPTLNRDRIPVIINLKTLQWSDHLQSPFAQASPASAMLEQLKKHFANEILNVK